MGKRLLLNLASKMPMFLRMLLLRVSGIHVGKNTQIARDIYVDRANGLFIGDDCFINYGVHFHCGGGKSSITLGNRVFIGPEVSMCCSSHIISNHDKRAGENTYGSIRICDGCWIGMRTVILPNVTIAQGCVIAAGAIVTQSTQPDGLYAGVPAKRIKDLD